MAVRPFVPRSGTRVANGTPRTPRRAEQLVHRLAVLAWKPLGDLERLLFGRSGDEVSHLCHVAACFNPEHLVVEDHGTNERRKACRRVGKCGCGAAPSCIL